MAFFLCIAGVDHPAAEIIHEFPYGLDMFGGHREKLWSFVEGFSEAAEPFLAGGFVDDKGEVAGSHHGRAVALLEEVRASEEEDEHGGVFFGGLDSVFLTLGEHFGDCGYRETLIEGVEHLNDPGFSHRFIDGWGDAVGLRGAPLWGVDRAVAWAVWVCVEDVHE